VSFSVAIVDADHRPDVYAEIERDEELVAEAFTEGGRMHVAFVDPEGRPLWVAAADELEDALKQARHALMQAGLLE